LSNQAAFFCVRLGGN